MLFFNRKKKQKENIKKIILASVGLLGLSGVAKILYDNYKKVPVVEDLTNKIKTNLATGNTLKAANHNNTSKSQFQIGLTNKQSKTAKIKKNKQLKAKPIPVIQNGNINYMSPNQIAANNQNIYTNLFNTPNNSN